MTKYQIVLGLVGAGLMSWGGAYIGTQLESSGTGSMHVVALAAGIVCFPLMAVAGLAPRVARLERELRALRGA